MPRLKNKLHVQVDTCTVHNCAQQQHHTTSQFSLILYNLKENNNITVTPTKCQCIVFLFSLIFFFCVRGVMVRIPILCRFLMAFPLLFIQSSPFILVCRFLLLNCSSDNKLFPSIFQSFFFLYNLQRTELLSWCCSFRNVWKKRRKKKQTQRQNTECFFF